MASNATRTPRPSDQDQAPSAGGVSTKEELLALIERLQNEKKDLEDQVAQRDAALGAGDEGWIISTPNPGYSGRTSGVLFENGHAFIPKGKPDAQRIVGLLVKDFGYSATETKGGHAVVETAAVDGRSVAEKLTVPGRMGV